MTKSVLIKPLFTEKYTNLSATQNKFSFVVSYTASKIQIAQEINKKFNVTVTGVNTIRYPGKIKTQFRKSGRFYGKTPRYKKAIVTLKDGDKIELFEQI